MNLADVLLILLLGTSFLGSCWALGFFRQKIKQGQFKQSLAPGLSLSWALLIPWMLGFALIFTKAPLWVIPYSLGSAFLVLAHNRQSMALWNFQPRDLPRHLSLAFLTLLALLIPLSLIKMLSDLVCNALNLPLDVQEPIRIFLNSRGWVEILNFFILACIIAPLWEEITFRGFLYPILKSKLGNLPAILLSAVLFASIHQNEAAFLPLTCFGIVLALLYDRSGSLLPSIFLHAFFNGFTCIFLLLIKLAANPAWTQGL
ncbi:MAG: CPBP family intramembrane metalloprotease [Blastochloris sp.]|nr:CPBP family intramembrane metalloprotease [Blastochloris sp.]